MKAAYDVGINFFDCAEGYSDGESERVMGQAIKKYGWKRNDLVISTKVILELPKHSADPLLTQRPRFIGVVHTAVTQSTMSAYLESISLRESTWPSNVWTSSTWT